MATTLLLASMPMLPAFVFLLLAFTSCTCPTSHLCLLLCAPCALWVRRPIFNTHKGHLWVLLTHIHHRLLSRLLFSSIFICAMVSLLCLLLFATMQIKAGIKRLFCFPKRLLLLVSMLQCATGTHSNLTERGNAHLTCEKQVAVLSHTEFLVYMSW